MKELMKIPGIGKSIAQDLANIGITNISQLKGKIPEDLYQQVGIWEGVPQDRCLLYVFRLAVYFAEHPIHEEEKLKWWYWKNHSYPGETVKSQNTISER